MQVVSNDKIVGSNKVQDLKVLTHNFKQRKLKKENT